MIMCHQFSVIISKCYRQNDYWSFMV